MEPWSSPMLRTKVLKFIQLAVLTKNPRFPVSIKSGSYDFHGKMKLRKYVEFFVNNILHWLNPRKCSVLQTFQKITTVKKRLFLKNMFRYINPWHCKYCVLQYSKIFTDGNNILHTLLVKHYNSIVPDVWKRNPDPYFYWP